MSGSLIIRNSKIVELLNIWMGSGWLYLLDDQLNFTTNQIEQKPSRGYSCQVTEIVLCSMVGLGSQQNHLHQQGRMVSLPRTFELVEI